MPVFEPADESGHYAHILYLWKQGRLPNLNEPVPTEKGVGYTTYSPLYYWSLIPLSKLAGAPLESEELLPYHPQKELFKKSVFAVYLHTKEELFFKWNKLMVAVHLLRLQTSVYGLVTVYLVYLTGKKVFGDRSLKPLVAASLVGFNPMFAHVSNSIVNVNLGILLFSVFFYLTVRSFANFSTVKFAKLQIVLGVITGLAYLTKITGLVLIPIWFLFTIIIAKTLLKSLPDRVLFLVKHSGLFLVGFLAAAGWYLARNYMLYGSLLEAKAAIKYFGRPAAQLEISGPINYWIGFVQTNFKTAFSGYGMVTVNLPDTVIYLLALAAVIGFWGVLISSKRDDPQRSILEGSSLIILLGHILVNIKVEAFHARDLFVGMVPFSLLFVLGIEKWWEKFKTGQFRADKLIYRVISVLFYVLTVFHFRQQALVDVIKPLVDGRQISLEPVLAILAATVVFVLIWRFFPGYGWQVNLVRNGRSKIKGLIWGLAAANLIILFGLVIPSLYHF